MQRGNSSKRWDRERDLRHLQRELDTPKYRNWLESMKGIHRVLSPFSRWAEVLDAARDLAHQDEILRILGRLHRESNDERASTVLLRFFWEDLLIQSRRFGWWDPDDPERFWMAIVECFLYALRRFDPDRRPDRIRMWILWRVRHSLYEMYVKIWSDADRQGSVDPEACEEWATPFPPEVDQRLDRDASERRLRRYEATGRMSKKDMEILLWTAIDGRSIGAYAERVGITYSAARKRHWRAGERLRRIRKKSCPRDRLRPPFPQ